VLSTASALARNRRRCGSSAGTRSRGNVCRATGPENASRVRLGTSHIAVWRALGMRNQGLAYRGSAPTPPARGYPRQVRPRRGPAHVFGLLTRHLPSPRPTNRWRVTNSVGRHQLGGASGESWSSMESWVVNELASSGRGWLLHRHWPDSAMLRHGTHQVAGILIQALDG
jgi:hypothetical protein